MQPAVHMMLQQTVSLVPEPSYPCCAYLALEQLVKVFFSKD